MNYKKFKTKPDLLKSEKICRWSAGRFTVQVWENLDSELEVSIGQVSNGNYRAFNGAKSIALGFGCYGKIKFPNDSRGFNEIELRINRVRIDSMFAPVKLAKKQTKGCR